MDPNRFKIIFEKLEASEKEFYEGMGQCEVQLLEKDNEEIEQLRKIVSEIAEGQTHYFSST